MKRFVIFSSILLASSFLTLPARACLWDSETLAAEMARLPEAVDVMTGNFPRHSRAFYEWRVQTASAALKASPDLIPMYDDLAVAQHKLGDNTSAIATMMEKERRKPGIYETASNLGTFYIFTGDLKTALEWIDKALKINADAHFGREKYQKWLVEWVLAGKPETTETAQPMPRIFRGGGFAGFAFKKQAESDKAAYEKSPVEWTFAKTEEAQKAILGMMRFADFDHPLLQEALGDILSVGGQKRDAKHLAALAYLHALKKSSDKTALKAIQRKLQSTLESARWSWKEADILLEKQLSEGAALTARVKLDEARWIKEGKDASALFLSIYANKQAPVPPGK